MKYSLGVNTREKCFGPTNNVSFSLNLWIRMLQCTRFSDKKNPEIHFVPSDFDRITFWLDGVKF